MALTLSTLFPIYPVYNQDLIWTAKESTATNNSSYAISVYMNGLLQDSFKYFASPLNYDCTVNLSTILQLYFTSSVYIPTGATIHEVVPNSIIPYYITVLCYDSGGTYVSSGNTGVHWTFNGCANPEENFDMQNFICESATTGNWLTNFSANRSITLGDLAYMSVIGGHYGSGYYSGQYNSVYGGCRITRTQLNYSTSAITESYSSTGRTIINLDVSPNHLNALHPGFINAQTLYYDVAEINGRSTKPLRIEINNETKLRKFYNFVYLNRLGGTDFFSFTKVSSNDYNITKNLLDQFLVQKVYYPVITKTLNVQSQYITPDEEAGLHELFESLAVKLWFQDFLHDIRLTNASITANDRYPKNIFLVWTANIVYNYRYYIQLY